MKKKSKAVEGKDENEIKFPIEILGENLSKSDLESLDEGQCVTSTVLDIYMKILETKYEKEIKNYNIELIKTVPAYMIQKGNKHESTTQLLNPIKIWEKSMAFMVVSKKDDPDEREGGEHYSLLTYNKRNHTFTHMDPIEGVNGDCARELYVNSLTKEMINKDGQLPKFVEINCTRQKNNYDCGPFTICYIWKMLDHIRHGTNFFVEGESLGIEETNMRQHMRRTIMDNADKTPKIDENENELETENPITDKVVIIQKPTSETEKTDKDEVNIKKTVGEKIEIAKQEMNKNNDKTINEKNINTNTKTDKANNNANIRNDYKGNNTTECRYFWRGTCKFGRECWFRHTELCQDWDRRNECTNDLCKLNHPKICYRFFNGGCNSNKCRFLHPSGAKPRGKFGMKPNQQRPEYDRNYEKDEHTQQTGQQEQNFGYQRNRGGNTRDNQMYMQQRGWTERRTGRAEVSIERFQRLEERQINVDMKLDEILRNMNHPRY